MCDFGPCHSVGNSDVPLRYLLSLNSCTVRVLYADGTTETIVSVCNTPREKRVKQDFRLTHYYYYTLVCALIVQYMARPLKWVALSSYGPRAQEVPKERQVLLLRKESIDKKSPPFFWVSGGLLSAEIDG